MIEQYHKHKDRRHKSAVKPFIFLLLELLALTLVCVLVFFQVEFVIVKVLVVLGAIFFFIMSSLKRYRRVRDRQRFYDE